MKSKSFITFTNEKIKREIKKKVNLKNLLKEFKKFAKDMGYLEKDIDKIIYLREGECVNLEVCDYCGCVECQCDEIVIAEYIKPNVILDEHGLTEEEHQCECEQNCEENTLIEE